MNPSVTTTGWAVAHLVNMSMAVLALIGITGLYLRQVRETGVLGLIGFMLFGTGFIMIAMITFAETVILPQIADVAPRYVNDFLATIVGAEVEGEVGGLGLANGVAGVTSCSAGWSSASRSTARASSPAGRRCCFRSARSRRCWPGCCLIPSSA
jgi:hypothetical protein